IQVAQKFQARPLVEEHIGRYKAANLDVVFVLLGAFDDRSPRRIVGLMRQFTSENQMTFAFGPRSANHAQFDVGVIGFG
ncbi:MAG TPA: hypothetical protein DCF78_15940, partial [Dehalococcoidia bacterium]|nr:hypothetical protein [Dehalococcoidia bacterium]